MTPWIIAIAFVGACVVLMEFSYLIGVRKRERLDRKQLSDGVVQLAQASMRWYFLEASDYEKTRSATEMRQYWRGMTDAAEAIETLENK